MMECPSTAFQKIQDLVTEKHKNPLDEKGKIGYNLSNNLN